MSEQPSTESGSGDRFRNVLDATVAHGMRKGRELIRVDPATRDLEPEGWAKYRKLDAQHHRLTSAAQWFEVASSDARDNSDILPQAARVLRAHINDPKLDGELATTYRQAYGDAIAAAIGPEDTQDQS